ncbi:MAG: DUF3048 domain-containing protein [Armatimonadota bacterium]|nr:DUF3048 domain-containing protein [Armatimonadota bacterium]MDR5697801.1 DUF3048 domain-containing protein [Armatimonadota bacterium]
MTSALLAVSCTARPDVSALPPLRLRAPGALLASILPGYALSADLATACPLVEGAGRLLAVVVDNDPRARPQSGLSQACLIYEVPTEAKIPRLLAVFSNGAPSRVGPVRSVRPSFLQLGAELGAVVAHSGGSLEAFRDIRRYGFAVINELWTAGPFWRVRDRHMPHNLYGSVPRLREAMARGGYDRPPARPQPEVMTYAEPEGPDAAEVEIAYPPGFGVRFAYQDGAYVRHVVGREHRDALTGAPIRVRAVIVQFVRWHGWREGRVDVSRVDLVGTGRALVFAEGRVTEATWRKADLRAQTAFRDPQGRGLLLAGPVWLALVPVGTPVTVR